MSARRDSSDAADGSSATVSVTPQSAAGVAHALASSASTAPPWKGSLRSCSLPSSILARSSTSLMMRLIESADDAIAVSTSVHPALRLASRRPALSASCSDAWMASTPRRTTLNGTRTSCKM